MWESLDVTLYGSAVHACRKTQGGWLDVSMWCIQRVDFVLDRSQIEQPIEQYQKHHLIKPMINQLSLTDRATKDKQLI